MTFEDGTTRRVEFHYGSGYLSQSSRVLYLSRAVEEVTITTFAGERRTVTIEDEPLARTGSVKGDRE